MEFDKLKPTYPDLHGLQANAVGATGAGPACADLDPAELTSAKALLRNLDQGADTVGSLAPMQRKGRRGQLVRDIGNMLQRCREDVRSALGVAGDGMRRAAAGCRSRIDAACARLQRDFADLATKYRSLVPGLAHAANGMKSTGGGIDGWALAGLVVSVIAGAAAVIALTSTGAGAVGAAMLGTLLVAGGCRLALRWYQTFHGPHPMVVSI